MMNVLDRLWTLILGLLHLVELVVARADGLIRAALAGLGITGELQTGIVAVIAIAALFATFRLFGRPLALLVAIFLIVFLIRTIDPGLDMVGRFG